MSVSGRRFANPDESGRGGAASDTRAGKLSGFGLNEMNRASAGRRLASRLRSGGADNQARRLGMAYFERIRDVISGPFSPEIIRQRTATGWQMVSIEWRRELPDTEAPTEGAFNEEIPYGLRISDDCARLEPDPTEHRVLMEMMEALAQDFSYSIIVSSLNEKGYRMRNGRP